MPKTNQMEKLAEAETDTVKEEIENAVYELLIEERATVATLIIRGDGYSRVKAENARYFLNENQITHALDTRALKELVNSCQGQTQLFKQSAVIARGKLPVEGVDGSIEHLVKQDEQVKIDEEGKADFRNVAKYHSLKANQILAKRTPAIFGKIGTDVFGQIIDPKPVKDPLLDCGPNVKYFDHDHSYRASINGIYVQHDDFIDVSPHLKIDGNVGLETGNLIFKESIHIEGNIERGSKVHSRGDIKVGGLIESGNVRAMRDLYAAIGINTNREGTVFTEGNLRAGYLENAQVVAIGNIIVDKSIISSRIISCGEIHLPSKSSVISGSEIFSYGSLEIGSLGNKSEITTTIQLGIHYRNRQIAEVQKNEIIEVKAALKKLTAKVSQIKQIVERATKPLTAEKKKQYKEIFDTYKKTTSRLGILEFNYEKTKQQLYNENPVYLKVMKTIYPGVVIHYREHTEEIKKPLTRCQLKFTSENPKPEILPFED